MADVVPQFEQIDNSGSTTQFSGTVGTTAVLVPASAGTDINEILIRCPTQTPNTRVLYWSLDDVTYHALGVGEYVGWNLKGQQTQIYLKGSVAGVQYEVLLNREA